MVRQLLNNVATIADQIWTLVSSDSTIEADTNANPDSINVLGTVSGTPSNFVLIGKDGQLDSNGAITVGAQAKANAEGAIALGSNTANTTEPDASSQGAIAIGGASTTIQDAIGIGDGATSEHVSIGSNSSSTITGVAIGESTSATGNSVAIGSSIQGLSNSIIIGTALGGSSDSDNIRVGEGVSGGTGSVVIGNAALASDNSTSVGAGADASGDGALSAGASADAQGKESIALGGNSTGGTGAEALDTDAIAIGNGVANDMGDIAIGKDTSVTGNDAIAIGSATTVTGEAGIAIGDNAEVTGDYGAVIGETSSSIQSNASANQGILGGTELNSSDVTNRWAILGSLSIGAAASTPEFDGDLHIERGKKVGRKTVTASSFITGPNPIAPDAANLHFSVKTSAHGDPQTDISITSNQAQDGRKLTFKNRGGKDLVIDSQTGTVEGGTLTVSPGDGVELIYNADETDWEVI